MPEPMEWDEFIAKLEWEGGIEGILGWGGPVRFPVEIQPQAFAISEALEVIYDALEEHGCGTF